MKISFIASYLITFFLSLPLFCMEQIQKASNEPLKQEKAIIQEMIAAIQDARYCTLMELLEHNAPILALHSDHTVAGNNLSWGNFLLTLTARYLGSPDAQFITELLLSYGANPNHDVPGQPTPLAEAALNNNVALAARLLGKKAETDGPVYDGQLSPLYWAVCNQNKGLVILLLKYQANPNWTDSNHTSVMHQASGNQEILSFLLDSGGKLNVCNKDGQTPLIFATRHNKTEALPLILRHEPLIDACDSTHMTALHYAALHNNYYAVKLLLEAHARIDVATERGTALQCAITHKSTAAAKLLLDYQANPHSTDNMGKTVLYEAVNHNLPDIVRLLLKNGANPNKLVNGHTPLHLAASKGHYECLQELIAQGGNIHARSLSERTPLHEAIKSHHTCQLLINKGANPNVEDLQGITPLFEAVYSQNLETADILLRAGACVNQSVRAISPLHLAACNGYRRLTNLLISYHANTNAQDGDGKTPLMAALSNHSLRTASMVTIIESLLNHGANPNTADHKKITPMWRGIEQNAISVVQLLLNAHADPNTTVASNTPLHLAVLNKCSELTLLLIRHGASVDAQNSFGKTPLHHAVLNQDTPLIKVLLDHNAHITISSRDGLTPLLAEAVTKSSYIKQYYPYKQMLQLTLASAARLGARAIAKHLTGYDLQKIYKFLKKSYQ